METNYDLLLQGALTRIFTFFVDNTLSTPLASCGSAQLVLRTNQMMVGASLARLCSLSLALFFFATLVGAAVIERRVQGSANDAEEVWHTRGKGRESEREGEREREGVGAK